jgi:hypothetical protein
VRAAPIEGLTPATVKRIKDANANYKECQQAAITALNSKLINQVKFNAAIEACRERFPAISLYSQCKRQAVAAAAATKQDPAAALNECKKCWSPHRLTGNNPYRFSSTRANFFSVASG